MAQWQYVGVENWYLPYKGYGMTILLWQAMMPAMSVVPNVVFDRNEKPSPRNGWNWPNYFHGITHHQKLFETLKQ